MSCSLMSSASNLVANPLEDSDISTALAAGADWRVKQLPFAWSKRHGVTLDPAEREVLYAQGAEVLALAEAARLAGPGVRWRSVDDEAFGEALARIYERDASEAQRIAEDAGESLLLEDLAQAVPNAGDLLEQEDDAPIIRLINAILTEALRRESSDVHVETFESDLVVRLRIDGQLREVLRPKRQLAPLLVSRIKVMAELDIAEKRVPQDGRISLRVAGREIDVRVSTMPTAEGERVVMRLLEKQGTRLTMPHLGMASQDLERLRSLTSRPHGILLVTGPTGSGKTTTLYASLSEVDTSSLNVLTVEDPIEYQLSSIGQTQVNLKADLSFAVGLRAILRQDPDVIMVGEIRDGETADIAIRASLTGHLVLSTLHTNTAIGAVTRLVDMGITPWLLASSLNGVMAQRLVRKLCTACRRLAAPNARERAFIRAVGGDETADTWHPVGCERCSGQGYLGRSGIYELIEIDQTMRGLVHDQASEAELEQVARKNCPSIREDAYAKVKAGLTSVDEALRVTAEI